MAIEQTKQNFSIAASWAFSFITVSLIAPILCFFYPDTEWNVYWYPDTVFNYPDTWLMIDYFWYCFWIFEALYLKYMYKLSYCLLVSGLSLISSTIVRGKKGTTESSGCFRLRKCLPKVWYSFFQCSVPHRLLSKDWPRTGLCLLCIPDLRLTDHYINYRPFVHLYQWTNKPMLTVVHIY
jgi:hypothetical protein